MSDVSDCKRYVRENNQWLNKRLCLEVSEEKTKIINLKKNYSEFLGIKLKVKINKKKVKIVSHMTDNAIESTKNKVKKQARIIKKIRHNKNKCGRQIDKYNSLIRGIHNYYNKSTNISEDLHNLCWHMNWYFKTKMRDVLAYKNGNGNKIPFIRGKPLIEIGKVKYVAPRYKGNKINYFDENSRKYFYKSLEIENLYVIESLLNNANV